MRAPRSHARGKEVANPDRELPCDPRRLPIERRAVQAAIYAGTEKGCTRMPGTAIKADIMIALVLASDPAQVGITRCLVRAALEYRGLGHYASEDEIIASELVTNAIQHASSADPDSKIGVTLMRVWDQEAISVVVTDSSPVPPVKRETTTRSEHGRGLQVVEALSAHWGWNHERGRKAVYAVLAKEG
jgi:anti-sigma regulatory factor (Ser/Thr protein kinase)